MLTAVNEGRFAWDLESLISKNRRQNTSLVVFCAARNHSRQFQAPTDLAAISADPLKTGQPR